ncbi:MAG TPA: VWA domain-containing protein [Kineosporiaceae bacterium]
MDFAWPLLLLSLLVLPLLVAGYVRLLRRRRQAVPYASVAVIRAAAPARSARRRHLPFAALLAALACLSLAAARPQAKVAVPISGSAVILALDVSGSMCATDVDPNRLSAAQAAVRDFVRTQDSGTRIGLVVFSGFAQLVVPPTTQRKDLLEAIDSLTTGRGTMIGAAILKSVNAIAQMDPSVQPVGESELDSSGDQQPPSAAPATPPPAPGSVPPAPEIVVLLTDGANTGGVTPLDAAKLAAARGVRIYPIGFGTMNPTTMVCTAQQLGGSGLDGPRPPAFGGFTGGGRRNFLVADEETLRQVARTTGGSYFSARDAAQLHGVLADLPRHVEVQHRDVEISVAFAALAAVLVLIGGWAAVRWSAFPS